MPTKTKIKHYSQVNDFTKKDFEEVLRRAAIFDQPGKDFTHVASGKVLGLGFFQESTRTASGAESAIIRLGGGWNGISSPAGSYVNVGEESMEETLNSLADSANILIVRHKNFDLASYAKKATVPLINGMCGGDEHSAGAIGNAYTLKKHFGRIDKVAVGFYGMVKSSRPAKALIRLLAKYKATFYVDPVVTQFDTPDYIRREAEAAGAKFVNAPLDEFIGKVDYLNIIEGLPQPGEDPKVLEEYNKKFRIMGRKDFGRIRKDAAFFYCMPAMMTDGRTIVHIAEADADPRCISHAMLREWTPVMMGLMTYLLDIKV